MLKLLRKRLSREGQSIVEYVLIIALIAMAVMTIMKTLGGTLETKFGDVNTEIENSDAQ